MRKLVALFAFAAMVGCSDDDDFTTVSQQVQNALVSKYPNAINVEWERKYGFLVADFKEPVADNVLVDCEAWFGLQGKWYMSEIDIPYSVLPEAVKTAFEASEYADWYIDDVDMVERESAATLYVIEVEKQDAAPVVKDVKDIKEVEEIASMELEDHAKDFVKRTVRKSDGESGIILRSKLDSQEKK